MVHLRRVKSGPLEALSGGLRSLGSSAQSELGRTEVVGVEQWADIRRLHFVGKLSAREIHRRTGLHRDTIRRALRSEVPPSYRRAAKGSKLDPFKDEIGRLLDGDPDLPGVRVGELLEPLGWDGGKTILDDYLREIRPFFKTARTTQRTIYRPGEICQFDVWEPKREIPVGHGQTRKGFVVVACLGYSRAGAGALVFSKQTPDLLAGIRRCLWQLGGLAETLVWDRQAGIHAHDGRPSQEFAALCGSAAGRLAFLPATRSAGQGRCCALAGLRGDELRTRPRVRQRAGLPGPVRRLEHEGQRAPAPHDPRPTRRPSH